MTVAIVRFSTTMQDILRRFSSMPAKYRDWGATGTMIGLTADSSFHANQVVVPRRPRLYLYSDGA